MAVHPRSAAGERVVYGIVSARALRVHWALAELDLPYRTEPILSRSGQTETAEYRRLNPRGKIPVLDDGGFILTESPAIVTYLGSRYGRPDAQLVPCEPEARARYDEWLSFVSMELDATSLYVIRRHEGLPQAYGEAPTATRVAREYFVRQIGAAASALEDGRPHLLGDAFSGADILMATCLMWSDRLALPLPPAFADYMARTSARPAFARAIAANNRPGAAPAAI